MTKATLCSFWSVGFYMFSCLDPACPTKTHKVNTWFTARHYENIVNYQRHKPRENSESRGDIPENIVVCSFSFPLLPVCYLIIISCMVFSATYFGHDGLSPWTWAIGSRTNWALTLAFRSVTKSTVQFWELLHSRLEAAL